MFQLLLLEVGPCTQRLFRVGLGIVRAGVGAVVRRGAEVGEYLGAVQSLPPEAVIRQPVVLAPADLDGEEVFETRLL